MPFDFYLFICFKFASCAFIVLLLCILYTLTFDYLFVLCLHPMLLFVWSFYPCTVSLGVLKGALK